MPSGVIIKGIVGFYYVKSGDELYECKPRGIFRKDGLTPLPGDKVLMTVVDQEKKVGCIDKILPRESFFVRPAVSNVNQLAVVIAVRSPGPDYNLLDKLLITSEMKDIHAMVCINKIDLDESEEHKKIIHAYEKAGYPVLVLSSKLNTGFDELETGMIGKITAFAGQSGVGKSTILNHIMKSWVMDTGEISQKIERGKHTTRHAELVELEKGGFVVDTPGFTSYELPDIKQQELQYYYPEFRNYFEGCKFKGCSHISEPGCKVKEALEKGLVDKGRYERYTEFYNELKQRKNYKK
ncbi:MAG: ribosome small subunit-dependent GTPase A [Clostridia bacterium]|nr:ribosome small subunit-dependent GTPase A [Clostridia bacterium]